MLQHHQQLGLVGMKPAEQAVEGDEAGVESEDAVELCRESGLAWRGWGATVGLDIAIELPDRRADGGLGGAVLVKVSSL
jgi:hypothetical protein